MATAATALRKPRGQTEVLFTWEGKDKSGNLMVLGGNLTIGAEHQIGAKHAIAASDMIVAFRYVFAAAATLLATSATLVILKEERPLAGPQQAPAEMAE